MKAWENQSTAEKISSLHIFTDFYNHIYSKIVMEESAIQKIYHKILTSEKDSFRDFIILFLLDKGYTVSDGFHFFSASGFNFSEEDLLLIMAEKFDISYDELLAYNFYSQKYSNKYTTDGTGKYFDIQLNGLNKEAQFLFADLTTRLEIFVEVHDDKFKTENPTKYMELLNSPITSLLSIKLTNNERINKALKKRLCKKVK